MISLSVPGGNFYLAMALSLFCLSTLLTWAVTLAANRGARRWLAAHRRLGPALMVLLAVAGAIFPYQHFSQWRQAQREAREQTARRAVLEAARRVDGIDMPAGTELRLAEPGRLDSFQGADFPVPAHVAGLRVTRLVRHGAAPGGRQGWSVTLDGNQRIDGWLCSRGHQVELAVRDGTPAFAGCHLAAGNESGGAAGPPGAWVAARQPGPWLLRTEGSDPLDVGRLPLLKVDMTLDDRRQVAGFEGLLARELTLGEMTYPTGTRVASAPAGLAQAQAGDLLFSPSRGRAARRGAGTEIVAGKSVLQAPDGTVRAVLANRDAGVLDFAAVRMAP